jgi:hypothetical protein
MNAAGDLMPDDAGGKGGDAGSIFDKKPKFRKMSSGSSSSKKTQEASKTAQQPSKLAEQPNEIAQQPNQRRRFILVRLLRN